MIHYSFLLTATYFPSQKDEKRDIMTPGQKSSQTTQQSLKLTTRKIEEFFPVNTEKPAFGLVVYTVYNTFLEGFCVTVCECVCVCSIFVCSCVLCAV